MKERGGSDNGGGGEVKDPSYGGILSHFHTHLKLEAEGVLVSLSLPTGETQFFATFYLGPKILIEVLWIISPHNNSLLLNALYIWRGEGKLFD